MRVKLYDNGALLAASGDDASAYELAEFDGTHHYHSIKVDGASWTETTVTVQKPAIGDTPAEVIVRRETTTGTRGGGVSSSWEETYPDGSSEHGSKSTDRDKNESSTVSRTDASGNVTITTYTRDKAGNSHEIVTAPDGSETTTDVQKDGSSTVTETTVKDSSGAVTKEERTSLVRPNVGSFSKTTSTTEGGVTTLVTQTEDSLQSTTQITTVGAGGDEISSSRQSSTWDKGSGTYTNDSQSFDGQGNLTSESHGFTAVGEDGTRSTSTRTEYSDGTTALTTTTSVGRGTTTSETTVVDAQGNTVSESSGTDVIGDDGTRSTTTSSVDADGNATLTTRTSDKEGNSTEHTTVTDAEGHVSSDTTEEHHAGEGSSGEGEHGGEEEGGDHGEHGGEQEGGDQGEHGGDPEASFPSDDGGGAGDDTPQRGPHISRRMFRQLDTISLGLHVDDGAGEWDEGDPDAQVRSALLGVVGRHLGPPADGSGDDRGEDAVGRPRIDVQLPGNLGDLEAWDDPNDPRAYIGLMQTLTVAAIGSADVAVAADQLRVG